MDLPVTDPIPADSAEILRQVAFVVIGGQRSGSTYFADLLAQHPLVHLPALELPIYEDRFFSGVDARVLERYFRRPERALLGIKRPDYLGSSSAAANLAVASPEARVVAVLRDPVERLWSAVAWYMYAGLIQVEPVEQVFRRLRDAAAGTGLGRYDELLHFGEYASCLDIYDEAVGSERVDIIFNDDLRAPESATVRVREYWEVLGLAPAPINTSRARVNGAIYDLRRLRFLRARLPFAFAWENEHELRYLRWRRLAHPLREIANGGIHLADRAVLKRIWRDGRWALPDHAREWAIDYYRPDLARLAQRVSLPQDWRLRFGLSGG
jgi:hypothetical protein